MFMEGWGVFLSYIFTFSKLSTHSGKCFFLLKSYFICLFNGKVFYSISEYIWLALMWTNKIYLYWLWMGFHPNESERVTYLNISSNTSNISGLDLYQNSDRFLLKFMLHQTLFGDRKYKWWCVTLSCLLQILVKKIWSQIRTWTAVFKSY